MTLQPADNETEEQRVQRLAYNARYQREYNARMLPVIKSEIFDILGRSCAHCAIDDMRVLEVDHINGGGAADRKLGGGSIGYYKRILKALLAGSTEFRCLCRNCNWIAHLESQPVRLIPAPRPLGRPKGAPTRFTHSQHERNAGRRSVA